MARELSEFLDTEKITKLLEFLQNKNNIGKSKKFLEVKIKLKLKITEFKQKSVEQMRQKKAEEAKAAKEAFEEARRKEIEKEQKKLEEWTEEEIRLLDKGLLKFPQVKINS